jgi:hypothetical protein
MHDYLRENKRKENLTGGMKGRIYLHAIPSAERSMCLVSISLSAAALKGW